jgi:hypothetical protein
MWQTLWQTLFAELSAWSDVQPVTLRQSLSRQNPALVGGGTRRVEAFLWLFRDKRPEALKKWTCTPLLKLAQQASGGDGSGSTGLVNSVNGNQVGTTLNPINPRLGPLQNNGGPTQTMALLPGSPAIDAGSNALAVDASGSPLTTDQRGPGFNRVINGTVDMGAYEFQPSATITTLVSSLNPAPFGQFVTVTVTVAATVPGSNVVQGTVTFFIDGVAQAPVALVNGVASFTTSTLRAGWLTIVAQYNGFTQGNYVFDPSTSAPLVQVVRPAGGLFATGADAGGAPEVKVYDASGTLRFDFFAFEPSFSGGVRVALADVNGDGIPDIIVGAGPGGAPEVKVFDGRSGALLQDFFAFTSSFTGGVFVAGGDINNDGRADIIVGADAGGAPEVKVFSGANGAVLRDLFAYNVGFTGGVRVAAGDVNGDGFADIITGAGPGGAPEVKVFSGASGALLQDYFAFSPSFTGGVFVAAGAVNGDGMADVIVGAGAGGAPEVKVFSGATGSVLLDFFAYPPSTNRTLVPVFGDPTTTVHGGVHVGFVTFGGQAAILTGPGSGQPPEVKVLDAVSLKALDDFFAYDPAFLGGVFAGG